DRTLRVPARRWIVRRVSDAGETLTFRAGSDLRACDAAGRRRSWCAASSDLYRGGRVRDPRLTICEDRDGRPLAAFAWLQPGPRTRWVVVEQPGHRDAYPVLAGLPVRVTTADDIDLPGARAVFDYAEYDARGQLVRRSTLVPVVAG